MIYWVYEIQYEGNGALIFNLQLLKKLPRAYETLNMVQNILETQPKIPFYDFRDIRPLSQGPKVNILYT